MTQPNTVQPGFGFGPLAQIGKWIVHQVGFIKHPFERDFLCRFSYIGTLYSRFGWHLLVVTCGHGGLVSSSTPSPFDL
jgi:hypothetical protein